jgi:hypothetical protein
MKKGYLVAILAVLALTGPTFADSEPDSGSMRLWLDGEYLLWWLRPASVSQPLLTTGPLTNPTSLGSGVLGARGTQVLAGNENLNTGPYSGFRVNGGWIDCSDTYGVEGSFFYLAQHATTFNFSSGPSGSPLLARPVIDARTGNETVLFVSAPNAFSGNFNVASTTSLLGADGNVLWPAWRGDCYDCVRTYFTTLAGFRYLQLRDDLAIMQTSNVLSNGISFFGGRPITSGSVLSIQDNIHTLNQFYGGQVGAHAGISWWRFTLNGTGKVAVGTMHETATLTGFTSAIDPTIGLNQTTPGGLLVLSSNSGTYTRNITAVIPEGNLSLSLEITAQLRLTLGYNILYVSDVARPGQLIDRSVNRTLIPSSQVFNPAVPGPRAPGFSWTGTDFWAQGVNIGISLRF